MEPGIQALIDKNKEEVRRAVEECDRRVEVIRVQEEAKRLRME